MSTSGRTAVSAIVRGNPLWMSLVIGVALAGCSGINPAKDGGTDASMAGTDGGGSPDGGDAGQPDAAMCAGVSCGANSTVSLTSGCPCVCNDGFVADLGNPNACVLPPCPDAGDHVADCDPHAKCTPQAGGNHSCQCEESQCYFGSGYADAGGCTVNNCCGFDGGVMTTQGPCPSDTTCGTTLTSVTCTCEGSLVAYPPGTTDPSVACIQNDCATAGFCDSHATCQNAPDGGVCACTSPLVGVGTPGTCRVPNVCPGGDVDAGMFCDVNATCSYSPDGGSACACKSPYLGDGTPGGCSLPDVCMSNSCDPHATCISDYPNFSCMCQFGYRGDGLPMSTDAGRRGDAGMHGCAPVDACEAATSPCAGNAVCTSTGPGTFMCSCDGGAGVDCHIGYQEVATTSDSTCAVRQDGTLWCWGDESEGTVGNGAVQPIGQQPVNELVPTQSGVASDWMGLSAGLAHVCAIQQQAGTNGGPLYCWGWNYYGQLGYDTYGPAHIHGGNVDFQYNSGTPAQAFSDAGTNWTSVALGVTDTCAINTAGEMWCWGTDNKGGSIGGTKSPVTTPDGGMTYSTTVSPPAKQSTTGVTGSAWTKAALGNAHICGIRNDGTLWCWGSDNNAGQIGKGPPVSTGAVPPTKVSACPRGWTDVAAGDDHTCGVCSDGTLWCWGDNTEGDIGIGFNNAAQNGFVPVTSPAQPLPHAQDWVSVACAQEDDHVCGTKTDGSVWCWGADSFGAGSSGQNGCGSLGIPNEDPETLRVVDSNNMPLQSIQSVSVGSAYSCAVDNASKIWCWGENANGQFGNNSQASSCSPTESQ